MPRRYIARFIAFALPGAVLLGLWFVRIRPYHWYDNLGVIAISVIGIVFIWLLLFVGITFLIDWIKENWNAS